MDKPAQADDAKSSLDIIRNISLPCLAFAMFCAILFFYSNVAYVWLIVFTTFTTPVENIIYIYEGIT